MKKTKRSRPPKSVDEYFEHVPEPAIGMLKKLRGIIRSTVPHGSVETISYGIPTIKGLLWYGAFANHCSLFPGPAVIELCKNQLQGVTTSKGTVQFPLDRPLPVGLVRRLVRTRIALAKDKARRRNRQ